MRTIAFIFFALFCPGAATADDLIRLDYTGFTIWYSCKERGAVRFEYLATKDSGNLKRYTSFYQDPNIPEHC